MYTLEVEDILKKSDAEILAIAKQIRVGYEFKRILRYRTTRDLTVHSESDAEHVFALIYLAQYFLRVEPAAASLNHEKVFTILLFHDFPEIKYGDIPSYEKTTADEERESAAAKEVFASLPEPLGKIGYSAWLEYEEQKTPEAKFAYALDKIEPLFELFDPISEHSLLTLKVTYELHISNKFPPVKNYPVMKRFTEVVTNDMLARDVFWKS